MSGQEKGEGGLDTVVLRHSSGATAQIYLWGATLTSFKTPDGKDHIFCSPKAIYDGKKAIRGGVPLVFPQFGQADKAMPQHGFGRISFWSMLEVVDSAEESHAIFTLCDSPESREKWNHAFKLEYLVSLTAVGLKLTLRAMNPGDAAFDFNFLLHTYLRVPAIEETVVCGLKGRTLVDKVKGDAEEVESRLEVDLPSFTDRVYLGDAPIVKDLTVKSQGSTCFALSHEGTIDGKTMPCDIVAWNPYVEASPGDLPPPAYKEFVCVEPGLVAKLHELAPGCVAQLSQTIIPV